MSVKDNIVVFLHSIYHSYQGILLMDERLHKVLMMFLIGFASFHCVK